MAKDYKDTKIYKNIKLKDLLYRYSKSNETELVSENQFQERRGINMKKDEEYPWDELKESIKKNG